MPVVEADERPVGGQLVSLERALRMIADHKRGIVRPEQLVDLGHEPARVAELEAVPARRELVQCSGEAVVVAPEVRGQLPEHRPHLW